MHVSAKSIKTIFHDLISAPECEGLDIRCESSGTCIEITLRCNGNPDCSDGSDEQNCAGKNSSVTFCPISSVVIFKFKFYNAFCRSY